MEGLFIGTGPLHGPKFFLITMLLKYLCQVNSLAAVPTKSTKVIWLDSEASIFGGTGIVVHCKTGESHVAHKFAKMQSGPMTNVISLNSFNI